jgi:hypothetical protein
MTRRLDVEEDPRFHRNDWRVQRVGWVLLALIIVAGLSGLLGSGPLSRVTAGGGGGPAVEYERFVRHGSESNLTIRAAPTDARSVQVGISRTYLDAMQVKEILPEPLRVRAAGPLVLYTFAGSRGASPTALRFVLQPDELGAHEAIISLGTGRAVTIRQFTYP